MFDSDGFRGLNAGRNLPVFQVWRPLLPVSNAYSMIDQVQFQSKVQIRNSRFF